MKTKKSYYNNYVNRWYISLLNILKPNKAIRILLQFTIIIGILSITDFIINALSV